MKKKKTAIEWYEELPSPQKERAIKNFNNEDLSIAEKEEKFETLQRAVLSSFQRWLKKLAYWQEVVEKNNQSLKIEIMKKKTLQKLKKELQEIELTALEKEKKTLWLAELVIPFIQRVIADTGWNAVNQNGHPLKYIKKQTPEFCMASVKRYGFAIQYVKKQTTELCLVAVKQEGHSLRFVKKQTPEICLEAVKKNGYALRHVKEQTKKICLEAVKESGGALKHVKEQTQKICLEAVKKNGDALEYVQEQTEAICLKAVKQNGYAITHVKKQTHEICLEAVKQNGYVLHDVKKQTPEICLEAIRQDRNAKQYISEEILEQINSLT